MDNDALKSIRGLNNNWRCSYGEVFKGEVRVGFNWYEILLHAKSLSILARGEIYDF